jgi:hypothetical protein
MSNDSAQLSPPVSNETLQAHNDILSWLLIVLMKKHRYKQFTVTKEVLNKIAASGLTLHGDDESEPDRLIVTIETEEEVDARRGALQQASSATERDGDVLLQSDSAPGEEAQPNVELSDPPVESGERASERIPQL